MTLNKVKGQVIKLYKWMSTGIELFTLYNPSKGMAVVTFCDQLSEELAILGIQKRFNNSLSY